jgi:hypothetical protein
MKRMGEALRITATDTRGRAGQWRFLLTLGVIGLASCEFRLRPLASLVQACLQPRPMIWRTAKSPRQAFPIVAGAAIGTTLGQLTGISTTTNPWRGPALLSLSTVPVYISTRKGLKGRTPSCGTASGCSSSAAELSPSEPTGRRALPPA